MPEDPVNREPGPSSWRGFVKIIKDTVLRPHAEVAKAGAGQAVKESVKFIKETFNISTEAFAASGRVLGKSIQEFANSLGIDLPKQGPVPKEKRVVGALASLIMTGYTSTLFLPIASAVLHGPAAGTPEAYAIAGLLTLPTSLPLAEAYQYAMGRKEF